MSSRDIEKELRDRARLLARADTRSLTVASESFVVFASAGQSFAVPLQNVAYAGRLRHLTAIPNGHPFLLGITLLSGHLISVLDVAALLALRRQGVGDVTCCLVIDVGGREIGLAAEQLMGIEEIPRSEITPVALGKSSTAISRVALRERLQILIIDPVQLVADARLQGGRGDG